METPGLMLTEPEFWHSSRAHVALPQEPDDAVAAAAAGLREFAEDELGARGWCFFQTSGSEGRQKWVALTKDALLASAQAVNAHFNITERDHWLLALPTHHVGGFGILARSFLSGSAVTRLEGKWNAAAFVQRCADVEATLASLVPTQVFDLVAAGLPCPAAMRVVLVGGGALSEEVRQAALALGWPVRRTYGMTETCSQVATQAADGDEMEVLPIWNLSTDADGVLTIRGQALAQGYAMQDGSGAWTWQPIPPESGLRTRDRVTLWMDGEGTGDTGGSPRRQFLRFVGREVGIIKILGELVALGPIQERMEALRLETGLRHGDAAVCDVADARKEAALALVYCGMSDTEAAALQQRLNATLRPLEQVQHLRRVEALPRSELGKVRLGELRGML